MSANSRSVRARIVSAAVALGIFGGIVGFMMERNDVWAEHLGGALERGESIVAGALLGAVLGVLVGIFGGDRRRGNTDPFRDGPGGD